MKDAAASTSLSPVPRRAGRRGLADGPAGRTTTMTPDIGETVYHYMPGALRRPAVVTGRPECGPPGALDLEVCMPGEPRRVVLSALPFDLANPGRGGWYPVTDDDAALMRALSEPAPRAEPPVVPRRMGPPIRASAAWGPTPETLDRLGVPSAPSEKMP